ncbi:B12-binding domain-containing radical SAM protein [Chloroflexota bacterium]
MSEEYPELVGISITCLYEVRPAFTLAHIIKAFDSQIHIVLGGAIVTQLAHRIAKNLPLWKLIDSLIPDPGEVAFTEMIERVEKKATLSGVPNIVYKDNGSIRKGDSSHEFDINESCTPEFASVRPKSGLPLETASGCYWGRSIFCYYPKTGMATLDSKHQKKRMRDMELVLEDIRKLKDRYDPRAIGITDSSVHPRRIEAIAEENLRSERKVNFSALFRLEKEFKSKEFCRKLAEGGFMGGYVGLESGSQRVNDIINKGVDLGDAGVILKNFHDAGILLHVFSIVGIPGETKEDALMAYDFFKRWHRWLKLDWVVYHLYLLEQNPLAQRASEFGLELTPLPDDYLVEFMRYKPVKDLSQEESVGLSISFTEKLRRFAHPLNKIMDIESLVLFLLMQKAKGIPPDKVRKMGLRM